MTPPRFAVASVFVLGLVACSGETGGPMQPDAGSSGGGGGHAPLPCGVAPQLVDLATATELEVGADPGSPEGLFDPSLVYDEGAPSGVLAYSSVAAKDDIHTRIAVSTDAGKTFTFVADANAVAPAAVPSNAGSCPNGTCEGKLVHEVPSIVDDATDPDPSQRFKLFSHRYLVQTNGTLRYDLGHIALQTAPAPEGPWSAPVPAVGWKSSSPLSSEGALFVATETAPLASCLALTEPGAVVVPGVGLELFLGCVAVDTKATIRVVLLRSTDHAASFGFVATTLRPEDATCVGGSVSQLNAPSPFLVGGLLYLSATPATEEGYRGCTVFPVDPISGLVPRDAAGSPVFVRRLGVSPDRFHGACAYAEGATALGYLVPAAFLGEARPFRVFASGIAGP